MSSTFFLVLRRMRAPLIVLIAIYTVTITGLIVIPGQDADGNPAPPLSVFHAFYFVSYTATTIGFGEIPEPFSDAQRLWVTLCIYLSVVGWSYAIVTILALLQDRAFRIALAVNKFGRQVHRLSEPFYIICGAGNTGTLIARGLDDLNRRTVIIELDGLRVQELDLEDLATNPLLLEGDASLPENLVRAGVRHPQCRGVIAVTNDDQANLAAAITGKLCNPRNPVLARTTNRGVAGNMISFGTDHVVNPFVRFARELAMSIASPDRYRLIELVTALPAGTLPTTHRPPFGRWVVCGYGRFGREVVANLHPLGVQVTVIDPLLDQRRIDELTALGIHAQEGLGTEADSLVAAGIHSAVGLVAGTDVDVNNLSIAITATQLNADLYVVCRQNEAAHDLLFRAFESDFDMVSSRIIAEECLTALITPLLGRFLSEVRDQSEPWCAEVSKRILASGRGRVPEVWSLTVDAENATAVHESLRSGEPVMLHHLSRDSADRDRELPIVALLRERAGVVECLPEPDQPVQAGDRYLFAGKGQAMRRQALTVQNLNALDYVRTGHQLSSGWVWRRLTGAGRR